jgi:hypothetical protein
MLAFLLIGKPDLRGHLKRMIVFASLKLTRHYPWAAKFPVGQECWADKASAVFSRIGQGVPTREAATMLLVQLKAYGVKERAGWLRLLRK